MARFTKEKRAAHQTAVLRMRAEGLGWVDIAKRLNLSPSWVRLICSMADNPQRKPGDNYVDPLMRAFLYAPVPRL